MFSDLECQRAERERVIILPHDIIYRMTRSNSLIVSFSGGLVGFIRSRARASCASL